MAEISPVIVIANHFQFGAGSRVHQQIVQSRMLLWCKEGKGEVVIDRRNYKFAKDDYLVIPWDHAITYKADEHHPFLVGGVHFIANHSFDVPVRFDVAHSSDSPLFDLPERKDATVFEREGTLQGSLANARSLEHLAEYIVAWYRHAEKTENEARLLGELLIVELIRAVELVGSTAKVPSHLSALLTHIRNDLTCKFNVRDMAEFARCSPPTITRQFRKHLDIAPMQWLLKIRLEQAAHLLTVSDLPVGEIGRRVGIDDPYYFTKRFKHAYGLTPTAYRNKISILARSNKPF